LPCEEQVVDHKELHDRLHPHVKPDDLKHLNRTHSPQAQKALSTSPIASAYSPATELEIDMEDEFNQVDRDGDGIISKEEWRLWIEEKKRLLRSHNQEKHDLVHEIRALRKSLAPESKELYEELFNGEKARASLEEELVKVTMNLETSQVLLIDLTIHTDTMNDMRSAKQKSLAKAKRRVLELETEKQLAMQHWKDKISEIAAGMTTDVYQEEKGIQCPEYTIDPLWQRAQAAKESLDGLNQVPLMIDVGDGGTANASSPGRGGMDSRSGGWLKPFLAAQVLRNAAANYEQLKQASSQVAQAQSQQRSPTQPTFARPNLGVHAASDESVSTLTRGTPNPTRTAALLKAAPKHKAALLLKPQNQQQQALNTTSKPISEVLYPDGAKTGPPKVLLGRPTHLFAGSAYQGTDHPLGPYYSARTQTNCDVVLRPPSPRNELLGAGDPLPPAPIVTADRLRTFGTSSKYATAASQLQQPLNVDVNLRPLQAPASPSVPSYMQPLQRKASSNTMVATPTGNMGARPASPTRINTSGLSSPANNISPRSAKGPTIMGRPSSPSRSGGNLGSFAVATQSFSQKQRVTSPSYSAKNLYGWK
jgi:hypothetical protein